MVICPDCGKDVKDAKFCSNCGASLSGAVEASETVEEIAPVEVITPSQEVVGDVIDVNVKEERADATEDDIEVNVNEETAEEDTVKETKFCPNCGREVDIGITFCPNCGHKFGGDKAEPKTKFCQSCGKKININAEICPHCGVRVANIKSSGDKSVLLSAILSFLFPGLGHIYLGLSKKGVSFIIAYIVSAILMFIFIGFVLMFIVWIWALIDSIKVTGAINNGEFVEDKLF